ncbi:AGE family epimerase/isomerase [Pelagicoccus sp. SDUM812005]|uniref:AGE family epimerase/isomerase n=1 Tax=Pelagicoccus sp. SDUM812005 TaxID=3041257 RepID=UPI00280FBE5E|nr:AGE family epimerase/isomerase [Pelagicoccus sp. SDUM812005]MDQ8182136.1 AGE family epimerase/isomerase [Pelagicoccus sp. SDUM812005]
MNERGFLSQARERYLRANKRSLEWLLARPSLHGGFLDSKLNSITLENYGRKDYWRGPEVLYGWIQGRGLEALLAHASFFEREEPSFSARLSRRAKELYHSLAPLYDRYGHGYFSYDRNLVPVYRNADDRAQSQALDSGLYTYSDIFILKGLLSASQLYDSKATIKYRTALRKLVESIEQNRFILNEQQRLAPSVIETQKDDYAPRMIMLGTAALLKRLGMHDEAQFGERFIEHIIQRHTSDSGTIRDVAEQDIFNPGHAIEFVGFAYEYFSDAIGSKTAKLLENALSKTFHSGFSGTGIYLTVSHSNQQLPSRYMPWWSLTEAIRAAALTYERTRSPGILEIWQKADQAFFRHYWREDPPLAYQTRTATGPIDYAPATPDLDPSYHTGLSFLAAIRSIDRMLPRLPQQPGNRHSTTNNTL